ncbi:MAG: Zn-ribbon domain-containing OB-fold protein [Candidatus Lokiarchaeota archaeon]|nr:Zn-ribbon domain-containing OB-fold protein [Candidatus Lokiarchaeota archaeon]
MSKNRKLKKDFFEIKWKTDLPYRYSIGKLAVKFFEELKVNKKILGSKCPKCEKVHFPPRAVCADCLVEMKIDDMVELPPKGTLEGFTVVNYPFTDPSTGGIRPFPYGYALFKLDGADTYTMHFVDETDVSKMKIGQRVEAVFSEERKGDLSADIPYFRIIKEEE